MSNKVFNFIVGLVVVGIVIAAGYAIGKFALKEDTSKPAAEGKAIISSTTLNGNRFPTLSTISHDDHLWVLRNSSASSPVHHPSCPCFAPAAR